MFSSCSFGGKQAGLLFYACFLLQFFLLILQDTFKLLTPGGGGYGLERDKAIISKSEQIFHQPKFVERGSVYEYRSLQESA